MERSACWSRSPAPRSMNHRGASAMSFSRSPVSSEEHTSELQSLMRHSSAVFCLKKKKKIKTTENKIRQTINKHSKQQIQKLTKNQSYESNKAGRTSRYNRK